MQQRIFFIRNLLLFLIRQQDHRKTTEHINTPCETVDQDCEVTVDPVTLNVALTPTRSAVEQGFSPIRATIPLTHLYSILVKTVPDAHTADARLSPAHTEYLQSTPSMAAHAPLTGGGLDVTSKIKHSKLQSKTTTSVAKTTSKYLTSKSSSFLSPMLPQGSIGYFTPRRLEVGTTSFAPFEFRSHAVSPAGLTRTHILSREDIPVWSTPDDLSYVYRSETDEYRSREYSFRLNIALSVCTIGATVVVLTAFACAVLHARRLRRREVSRRSDASKCDLRGGGVTDLGLVVGEASKMIYADLAAAEEAKTIYSYDVSSERAIAELDCLLMGTDHRAQPPSQRVTTTGVRCKEAAREWYV